MEKECDNCGLIGVEQFRFPAECFQRNKKNIAKGDFLEVCALCRDCFEERNEATKAVLTSSKGKRLIVAGPGTGKTHAFKEVLRGLPREKEAVVFTLINNLADDLKNEIEQLGNGNIKAATFHGFCKGLLHTIAAPVGLNHDFEYFPLLPTLIENDAAILGFPFSEKGFARSFAELEENDALRFYLQMSTYYNAAAHSDAVFRTFCYYEENLDKMPEYELIIGDEYQDFNKLEASFINLFVQKSKLLLAGDDDQALYGFRHASKEFIRNIYQDVAYQKLALPFCSRCTQVLVDVTNHFVERSKARDLLKDRIPREYKCYWPDKYSESATYPNIHVAQCASHKSVMKLVKSRIEFLRESEDLDGNEKDIQFLIIGPESGFRIRQIQAYLEENLDKDIYKVEGKEEKGKLVIEDGYRILNKGKNLNLGWRVILYFYPIEDPKGLFSRVYEHGASLEALLRPEFKAFHRQEAKRLLDEERESSQEAESDETRVRVKLTNFYGAKGLSALHTIIVGLNDFVFPKNPENIKDDEVCKFIVALTRAKRSCCLVTNKEFDSSSGISRSNPSTFIGMLPSENLSWKKYTTRNFS